MTVLSSTWVRTLPDLYSAYADMTTRLGRKAPSLPWPDIGPLGKWSVSSYKFGFGAECLNDDDPETFWQ